jgi:hypothetical protein
MFSSREPVLFGPQAPNGRKATMANQFFTLVNQLWLASPTPHLK